MMDAENVGGDCDSENDSRSEALITLEELEAFRDKTAPNWKGPRKLNLQTIHRYPHLLQPREIDPGHVRALCKAIKTNHMLEPLTVVRADTLNILIDGHHRFEAYEQSGVGHVPVQWFDGTIRSAVLEAGRANNRAKLSMADGERMQFAWRLTLLRRYSLKEVQEAAGISDGQARKMRQTLNKLGQNATIPTNWYRALRDASGTGWTIMDDDERERQLDAQVQDYARRLRRTFHTKLATNPELAARTLAVHFGKRLPDVVGAMLNLTRDDDDFLLHRVPLVPPGVLRDLMRTLVEHVGADEIDAIRQEVQEAGGWDF